MFVPHSQIHLGGKERYITQGTKHAGVDFENMYFSNKSQFPFAIHCYPLHCECAQHQNYSDCGHHSLWLIWLAYGSVAFAGTEIIKSGRKS